MIAKILVLLIISILSVLFWYASVQYDYPELPLLSNTFMTFAIIYFVFKIILESIVAKNIPDDKSRYLFGKAISIIYLVVLSLAIVTIWIPNPEALFVAYGLVAAGIAIAISDFFKNIAGGIIIFFTRPFSVGDRIEINNEFGDVIDIDIMYTTLMEIREWVDGDQATGRLTMIPNGLTLSAIVNNYTKDNEFIWDEIKVPVTYESDWRAASKIMLDVINRETKETIEKSTKEYAHLKSKYYMSKRSTEPAIFMKITDNWIDLSARYLTPARERRAVANKLHNLILNKIEKSKKITVASATYEIVGFPEIKVKK